MKYFTFSQKNEDDVCTINLNRIRNIDLNKKLGIARIEMTGLPYNYYIVNKETHDKLLQALAEK